MEESRKQFEMVWSKDKSPFTEDDELKQFAWGIWRDSRATIEIELPKCHDYTNQDTTRAQAEKSAYNSGVYDSADAIRAAGLTVKGDR